jgi:hypothetical protein
MNIERIMMEENEKYMCDIKEAYKFEKLSDLKCIPNLEQEARDEFKLLSE